MKKKENFRIMESFRIHPSLRLRPCDSQARQKGVTLIEMMVTIGIIGILLAITAGAYASWRENTRVDAAKEEIVSILQQARLTALSRRASQTVTFNFTGAALNPDTVVDMDGQLHTFPGITLEDYTCSSCGPGPDSTATITFTTRGTAGGQSVRISSTAAGREFFVVVSSATGRVDIRRTCSGGKCK